MTDSTPDPHPHMRILRYQLFVLEATLHFVAEEVDADARTAAEWRDSYLTGCRTAISIADAAHSELSTSRLRIYELERALREHRSRVVTLELELEISLRSNRLLLEKCVCGSGKRSPP